MPRLFVLLFEFVFLVFPFVVIILLSLSVAWSARSLAATVEHHQQGHLLRSKKLRDKRVHPERRVLLPAQVLHMYIKLASNNLGHNPAIHWAIMLFKFATFGLQHLLVLKNKIMKARLAHMARARRHKHNHTFNDFRQSACQLKRRPKQVRPDRLVQTYRVSAPRCFGSWLWKFAT